MKIATEKTALKTLVLAGVSLMSLTGPMAVWADDEGTSGDKVAKLDTVFVSARKIEESVQDAPISISAYSGAELEDRGLENLTEIARSTPGFSFENYNGAFAKPVIRGQSQNRLTNPVQNVATFYNGVYLPRGYMVDASLLNIGQVEILRGPQSAALGRNAYAGAVNFISKTPSEEFGGKVLASYGENDYKRVDVSAEGALIPGVLSVAGGFSAGEFDGSWKNNHALADASDARTKGNLGGYEYTTWTVGAQFTPTDKLDIKFNYMSSERDVENSAAYVLSGTALYAVNTLNCSPSASGANQIYCGELPVSPTVESGETRKSGLVVDPRTGVALQSDILSLEANYDISDTVTLAYLFGHAEGVFEGAGSSGRDPEVGYNGPQAPYLGLYGQNLIDTSGNGSIESDSHEIRLTWSPNEQFTGYIGGFYSDSEDLTKYALVSVPAQTSGELDPGIVLNFAGYADDSLNAREIVSVFAFMDYTMGPWSFGLEGRYTEEDITETNNFVSPSTSASKSFDYFTPRVTVGYELTATNRLYASFASGTKAGGFNTGGSAPDTFADPSQATYDPEENDTFELGSRNEFLEGDLILNGTIYYIDATNIQVSVPKEGANGAVIGNRAAAETWGVEIEADYTVNDNLNVYGGIGYAHAEYGDNVYDPTYASRCDGIVCVAVADPADSTRTAVDISGNRLERTPQLTVNAGFGWDAPLTENVDYFLRGNLSYQDKQYSNSVNLTAISDRTILDASVGVVYDALTVTLSADNLLDEKYVSSAFETNFLQTYVPNLGDRRRVALTVAYEF